MIIDTSFKIMTYTLATTQITQKIVSVLVAPLCEQTIVQTPINGQRIVTIIIMYGTMAEKHGATLKGGSCTSLLICRICKDRATKCRFARSALWVPNI